jgi:hypothetical protein
MWQLAARRHAIIAWRDDYRLRAAVLMNAAAVKALAGLEAHLAEVDTIDALRAPNAFAARYLQPELAAFIRHDLATLLEEAAGALVAIDTGFSEVADTLRCKAPGTTLVLATAEAETPADGVPERSAGNWFTSKIPSFSVPTLTLPKVVRETLASGAAIAEQIHHSAQDVIASATMHARETTGLHDRLRTAARLEIHRHWLGPDAETDLPLLHQLDARFDLLAEHARSHAEGSL